MSEQAPEALSEYRARFIYARARYIREESAGAIQHLKAAEQARAEWDRMLSLLGRPAEPKGNHQPQPPIQLISTSENSLRGQLHTLAREGYRFAGTIPDRSPFVYVVMQLPEER